MKVLITRGTVAAKLFLTASNSSKPTSPPKPGSNRSYVGKRARIAAKLFGEDGDESQEVASVLLRSDNRWLRRSGSMAMENMETA